jgi:CBS domain containing-hemolysin-like protein
MPDLIVIFVTILFSFFFSGMEIAFVSANRMTLELDKQQKSASGAALNIFSNNPEQYIATMLVGNNIALVVYGLFIAQQLEPMMALYFSSDILILISQTIVSTLIILFTAEFLPKTLFRVNANGSLRLFAIPVLLFYIVLWPIANFAMFISKGILKMAMRNNIGEDSERNVFTKVDLDHYVSQADLTENHTNEEHDNEVKLFKNALDFSKVKLRDCLVPRTELVAIDEEEPIEELQKKFVDSGYSKILVYRENIDNIIGYVHTSQMFKNPTSIKPIVNSLSIVPETMSANKLLSLFTQKRKSIALVVDEFGGTSGLVTSEDILEEIFGEIEDEHDTDDWVFKLVKDREWIISARYDIGSLNERLPIEIPESDQYDTLAGYIIHHHESIPKINTIIGVEPYEFRILKATNTRIELVLMKLDERIKL